MIAIIAGMQRSGSTYCFNVARELLAVRGGVCTFATDNFDETLQLDGRAKHVLVKTHHPDQRLSSLIRNGTALAICTVRKPEDAVASWMETFGFGLEDSIQEIRKWLQWHRQISDSTFNISFEDVELRPLRVVFKIGMRMKVWASPLEMYRIRKKYDKRLVYEQSKALPPSSEGSNVKDIGFSYYDRSTFFHRRHVSTPQRSSLAVELLSTSQVEFIRRELSEFVCADGFYRW